MKNLVLALFAFYFGLALFGGEISKTFHFSEPLIVQTGDYQVIKFDECLNTGYTGAPSLPWYAVKLLLPPGEKAVSFSVSVGNENIIEGSFLLYPQQSSRPLSQGGSGSFYLDEEVYKSTAPYPNEPFGIITTEYMNGYGIALLNICPLMYLPAEGKLSYHSEITVHIKTEPSRESDNALSILSSSPNTLHTLENFIQNPELISSYPLRRSRTDDYQLLIITPQAFENEFDDLTDLYMYRGLTSEVATTEEISSSMTGQDLQQQIRNYIIQEVQDHNVEFVLLGGDVEHIPYRGFYCYVQSGSGYTDSDIPADLYYSALDGSWNNNGNNLWGEIGEDDLLPDVAVGRFSFSNQTELNAMLHKTTSYQDNPIMGEFTNPQLAGEHLWADPITWGSDYINLIVGYQDDNGYTTIGIPPDHTIDSLYEKWGNWGGSTIMAEINEGKSFVHHCGHANSSTVMHLNSSDITNANFSQVNGITHNYTFVFSHGCICGAFDNSDCIMEYMVKIENFAAAVIGNSRYGWFNEGQTEGPSAHLHRELVDAMYEEQMGRLGAAFVECKIQTSPWVNAPGQHEEGALRWNFYDINILGDPTLQVWTEEPFTPTATYTSPIVLGDTSLEVTVINAGVPAEGLSCALIKDGVLHGVAITDANGEATISIYPLITEVGTADLSISGYNCLTTTFNVIISPAAGPFIIYNGHTLDDTLGGNSNGVADFGESLFLSISLANAGGTDATNVEAVLSNGDQYLTVTDNFGEYGTIVAGTMVTPINEYAFEVDDYVPDQHVVDLTLNITGDGNENWSTDFSIILNAPVLEAGEMTIDDNLGGNGDGFLAPGESAIIRIGVLNTGHSDAPDAMVSCSTLCEYISPSYSIYNIGKLVTGINQYAEFQISVDDDTPIGTYADFYFNVNSGDYSDTEVYSTTIGLLVEDWESGDFSKFNWQFATESPWEMCPDEPWEGDYCVRSGDVDDDDESELYVTLDVLSAGELSFYRKLSSEPEWDFLEFYIDYELMGKWSGELDWEMVSFYVDEGIHTFRWVYNKDLYYSNGEDCAWVDFIVFPPVDIATGIPGSLDFPDITFSVWPNPARNFINIDFTLEVETNVSITLYDLLGQELLTIQSDKLTALGTHGLRHDVSQLKPGIYFCSLVSSEAMLSKKIVIR